jgi:putative ABC transport system permease protein
MLIIACANLAGLQVTRAFRCSREYAVRAALGGSRRQLMAPLLVENLVLSLAGGGLGLLVASWCNELVGNRLSTPQGLGFDIPIDARVFAFAAATAIGCGLAFGLAPALFASRSSSADALKDASRSSTPSRAQQRLKRVLIVGQLALALALVGVATSLGIGLRDFARRSLGWEPERIFTARIVLPYARYPRSEPARIFAFQRALLERLAAIPGADHAALAGTIPFWGFSGMGRTAGLTAEGQPPPEPGRETQVEIDQVSADFFATLRIPFRQGTSFRADLKPDDPPVAVVNRSLAERLWPGENPVGRRVRFAAGNSVPGIGSAVDDSGQWIQIGGVVEDIRMACRVAAPLARFQVYLPLAQRPGWFFALAVRTSIAPETLESAVRRAMAAVDPELPVIQPNAGRTIAEHGLDGLRLIVGHLGVSAGMGLVIAAIGLFAVIAQVGAQRAREIGVRIALGAQRIDIAWLVVGEAGRSLGLGIAAGLLVLYPLIRIVHGAVPEIELPGTWLWAANIVLLAAAGLLACWLPARKATRINPIEALRTE